MITSDPFKSPARLTLPLRAKSHSSPGRRALLHLAGADRGFAGPRRYTKSKVHRSSVNIWPYSRRRVALMTRATTVVTGIDLPFGTPSGSMRLLEDIYIAGPLRHRTTTFTLPPRHGLRTRTRNVKWVNPDQVLYSVDRDRYIRTLSNLVAQQVNRAPDIVHVQHLAFGMTPALLMAFDHTPTIAFCHGTDLLAATKNPQEARSMIEIADRVDRILFPTLAMYQLCSELSGLSIAPKSEIVPWGIPSSKFELLPMRSGRQYVLFAGRSSPEKGLQLALPVLNRVRCNSVPLVISDGDLGTRALAHVEVLPWQSRDHVRAILRKSLAVLIPSTELEAFSLLAVEAQMEGAPVFHSGVRGLAEILGGTGIQADFSQPETLALQIEAFCSKANSVEWHRISLNGKNNALKYGIDRFIRLIEEIELDVIGRFQ